MLTGTDYALLIVSVLFEVILISVSYSVFKEYNWLLHNKIGAQQKTQDLYKRYLIFMALLKLGLMLGVISAYASGNGFRSVAYEVAIDIIYIISCVATLIFGWTAVCLCMISNSPPRSATRTKNS